ncbi:radical SAM family heme chaperone HemW [Permianibacter sp. IMCC34836]|uniref:radical SAM family heme chaperone HemW n=1 Tax=Permianibacter fluminis TaxID=2738515 RepID=UPI0015529471|nr:radical SAM family heme chaperone HemW [Permianibacter fluminis]NQD35832.1 radical SAM family heme chaperone HemW [Permianibacter fluminis]
MFQQFSNPLPLSLYVHIPWCVRKCPYCDFNSHESKAEIPEAQYIDALLRDLEQDLPRVWGRRISSIFFGGGTPSLFSPEAIDRLLSGVRSYLPFMGDIEITMEANPGTAEARKFKGFRDAGINRLSIGVQSFQPQQLERLGRIHGELEARRAAEWAIEAGFDNFNLDLMHGLPGQTVADALRDLETAIALKPTHLSWYQLTIEPNTRFAFDPPALPDDEVLSDIQDAGHALLQASGYPRYEVSAYAPPARRALHNLNYWQFGDYLGIGAGAHGKITDLQHQRAYRLHKKKHPKDYLAAGSDFIAGETTITADDMPFEFMMNALRLVDGLPAEFYGARTGLRLDALSKVLQRGRDDGLLQADSERLAPTDTGLRYLNSVLQRFMADELARHGDRKIIPIVSG